ncbi:psychosine receptor-like [Electrophorus electricus]|uniref:psychosine receptor-like n=1 Tax=Electrophorus electricus TaxID=8005 RepID=UPI0015CFE9CF|nr:psychosine receptor-like [Electrophorus electricus]
MNATPTTSVFTTSDQDCYPSEFPQKLFFFILHLVVILFGIPSNAFSLYVSYRHIKQKNEMGVYLFNLAFSDLCFIAGLPIWMEFTYYDYWRHDRTVCAVCVFLLYTNFYTSTVLLSCIAIDRYLGVVHPFSFLLLRKPSTAAAISAIAWAFTITFNYMTISLQAIYDSLSGVCLDVFPLTQSQKRVYIARFFVGFLLPALVVAFCYQRICTEVRANQATGLPERRQVFKLLGAVLLSLFLCFGPVHVMMLLRAVIEDCRPPAWLFLLYKISAALSNLNCLADPLLYCFITKTGRARITQALLRVTKKVEREEERL